MIKNYFKFSFRNIIRQKNFSIINILGLSIGIASFMLIMLYVKYEFSYDKHIPDSERIYRVTLDISWDNYELQETAIAPGPTAYALQNDYPEFIAGTRLKFAYKLLVEYDPDAKKQESKKFYESNVLFVDSSFLKVFDFEIISGNKKTALSEPNSIVISESAARKYFGDENPIGKTLIADNSISGVVKAVMKDIPENTHFYTDFIVSAIADNEFDINNWRTLALYSYVKAAKNVELEGFDKKFLEFEEKYYEPWKEDSEFRLQKLNDIHLYNDRIYDFAKTNNVKILYLLSGVGLLILLIACINYMNLSTAQSLYRNKEIGIRKVVGASRGRLIRQMLGESLFLSVIAVFISIVLVESFIPEFRRITETNIALNYSADLIYFFAIALVTGVLSGTYPAFFASSFKPIKILKGTAISYKGGNVVLRKVLVSFQFVVMAILIIGVLVIYLQMNFIKNKDLGFDKEQIIYTIIDNDGTGVKSKQIKNILKSHPGVLKVSNSNLLPGITPYGDHFYVEGKKDFFPMRTINIDEDYLNLLNIELVRGRNFSPAFSTDTAAVLVNETAVDHFGWDIDEAIGKEMKWNFSKDWDDIIVGKVIGVVKDFHFKSLHENIDPLVFTSHLKSNDIVSLKISPHNTQHTIDLLEKTCIEINPAYPFEFSFLDKELNDLYTLIQRLGQIITYFVLLAVLIACLGLIGLSAFVAEKKFHEIGIRKTYGATTAHILKIFNKEFIWGVIIANIIAWPIGWYVMNELLTNFAYRITIPWWVFLITISITLTIAIITVSVLGLKAANKNPVDALRYE